MFPAIATIVLIVYQAIAARAAGGGIFRNLGRIPEALFALPFGLAAYALTGSWPVALAAVVWSLIWMESGHGTAFHMGRRPGEAMSGRKQFLSIVIDPLCKRMGKPLGGSTYCWLFMGLKGLLIGLPAGLWGITLAILWPLAYEAGRQLEDRHIAKDGAWCEWLSGAAAGLVVGLALFV